MAHKTIVGGTSYEMQSGRFLLDGAGYDVDHGRTLMGGTGYDITFGTPASDLAVGSSVWINVNGVAYEWLIINQGLPSDSTLYDSSCDGTWLLMKDIYESRQWHSSVNNDYQNSDIHSYLNSTFFELLDPDIQTQVKTVKIPYIDGPSKSGADKGSLASGENGLSTQVFLLGGYEIGWTMSTNSYLAIDGSCLSYFDGATDDTRIAYLDGTATAWLLRSQNTNMSNSYNVFSVTASGSYAALTKCNFSRGVRPALILPSDTKIDDNGFIVV